MLLENGLGHTHTLEELEQSLISFLLLLVAIDMWQELKRSNSDSESCRLGLSKSFQILEFPRARACEAVAAIILSAIEILYFHLNSAEFLAISASTFTVLKSFSSKLVLKIAVFRPSRINVS